MTFSLYRARYGYAEGRMAGRFPASAKVFLSNRKKLDDIKKHKLVKLWVCILQVTMK